MFILTGCTIPIVPATDAKKINSFVTTAYSLLANKDVWDVGALRHMIIFARVVWVALNYMDTLEAILSDCCDTVEWAEWEKQNVGVTADQKWYLVAALACNNQSHFASSVSPHILHLQLFMCWWRWSLYIFCRGTHLWLSVQENTQQYDVLSIPFGVRRYLHRLSRCSVPPQGYNKFSVSACSLYG